MRRFIHELLHAESIPEVLADNRKEAVKLAAILVVVTMVILLYLHQSNEQLEVSEVSGAAGSGQKTEEGAGTEAEGDGALSGEGSGEGSGEAAGVDDGAIAGDGSGLAVTEDGTIFIDIDGAVTEPKLAELPAGSRVEDAIEAAGGVTKDADLSGINRAQILNDGEKIYIPKEGEEQGYAGGSGGGSVYNGGSGDGGSGDGGSSSGAAGSASSSGGRININTADSQALQQITGIGPVTAQKIIDYREANGRFSSIEDIKNVSGIGDKTFEKMRDQITT